MRSSNNFEYLVGDKNISKKPTQPYSEIVCNFLGDLSDELNLSISSKNYADIKTFAFWCRKRNIYNLKKKFPIKRNKTRFRANFSYHSI